MDPHEQNRDWRMNPVIRPIIGQINELLSQVELRQCDKSSAHIPIGFHIAWARVLNNQELNMHALLSLRRTAIMIHLNTFNNRKEE